MQIIQGGTLEAKPPTVSTRPSPKAKYPTALLECDERIAHPVWKVSNHFVWARFQMAIGVI